MSTPLDKNLLCLFGEKNPVTLDPAHTALIVVDMQYFDAHRDWGEGKTARDLGVEYLFEEYYQQLDNITPQIQKLLSAFRKKQMEVIHLTVSEVTNDSRDVGYKQLVRGLICPANSKEAQLLDEVKSEGDEIIIKKSSSGVFPVTNFDRLLRNMEITKLVFTGTSTGGCVESAVRDAMDLGYEVVVVSDACASGKVSDHELALWRMECGLVHILSTEEILSQLENIPDNNRLLKSGIERVKPYLPKSTEVTVNVDPYSIIFPPAIEQHYTKRNTALVVLDMTRFACDPSIGLGAKFSQYMPHYLTDFYQRVEKARRNIQKAIAFARENELPVLFFRLAGKRIDGSDIAKKYKSIGIQFGYTSPEAEWVECIKPSENDVVFNKPGSSMFNGTGIDEYLRNTGIEYLIITGASYDAGIESSIRSCTDRGYSVLVLSDACAAVHDVLQKNLEDMEVGLIKVMKIGQLDQLCLS